MVRAEVGLPCQNDIAMNIGLLESREYGARYGSLIALAFMDPKVTTTGL